MIGVPVVWAIVLLFHPTGDGEDFYPVVSDEVTAFVSVHVGTLIFIPLLAATVYLLLRGVEGTAARVSRIALVPFVIFYATWEVLVGVGVGLLADEVNGLSAAGQLVGAKALEAYADSGLLAVFEMIGMVFLLVALTSAGLALWRHAGAPLAVPVLFVLAAVPLGWHVTPFGQFGLALFIVAVLLAVRARSAPGAAGSGAVRPTAA